MSFKKLAAPAIVAIIIAGCGQAADKQSSKESETGGSDLASETTGPETAGSETTGPVAFEAISGEYKSEERHRYITFSYLHQGYSRPWVRWRDWDATLDWDAENPENSSISVLIDPTSVDSGVDVFDGHLQGENFFDTANYPEITFASTSLSRTGDVTGTMTGDLTMKGVTKPVTLDVTFNKGAFDERNNIYKLGFSAKTSLNRSEFDMSHYVPVVSDQVDIVIEAEFTMPAGE